MIKEVERRDIKVMLNTKITTEKIKEINPDTVIFATGAEPNNVKIKGIEYAHQSLEVYKGNINLGKKIVFIGGGLIGVKILNPAGEEEIIKGDTILYALGMKSVNIEELKAEIKNIEMKIIGDAVRPGKVDRAIREGYLTAINL